jgi:hypothetical protein
MIAVLRRLRLTPHSTKSPGRRTAVDAPTARCEGASATREDHTELHAPAAQVLPAPVAHLTPPPETIAELLCGELKHLRGVAGELDLQRLEPVCARSLDQRLDFVAAQVTEPLVVAAIGAAEDGRDVVQAVRDREPGRRRRTRRRRRSEAASPSLRAHRPHAAGRESPRASSRASNDGGACTASRSTRAGRRTADRARARPHRGRPKSRPRSGTDGRACRPLARRAPLPSHTREIAAMLPAASSAAP